MINWVYIVGCQIDSFVALKCSLVQTISHVVFKLSWGSAIMSFLSGTIKTPLPRALRSFLGMWLKVLRITDNHSLLVGDSFENDKTIL